MKNEIGSEFWATDLCEEVTPVTEKARRFLLSGRTALDFIIRDIKASAGLDKVYLPSYCCHTMIQPFLDNGVCVEFYQVNFKNGKYTYELNFENPCSAVLIMQYFGFCNDAVADSINRLRESGKTVIEDATHSWFSNERYSNNSDYVFASFRKWTGLPGGAVAIKRDGDFSVNTPASTNTEYISIRENAELLKEKYINNGMGEKTVFLDMFGRAEKMLEQDYSNYNLPELYENLITTLDYEKIISRRKSNATVLTAGIMDIGKIESTTYKETDVPLFVPIMVPRGMRDALRRHLIENKIFCPVHWPLSDLHKLENKYLYENSLSLVCDQRYSTQDMDRVVLTIKDFLWRCKN